MTKFKRVITLKGDAYTFSEFIKIITNDNPVINGVAIGETLPWSGNFRGVTFTHETDEHYILTDLSGCWNFEEGQVILFYEDRPFEILSESNFNQNFIKQ